MFKKKIKLQFIVTIIAILLFSSNIVFPAQVTAAEADNTVAGVYMNSNLITKTGPNTTTFKYYVVNKSGLRITKTALNITGIAFNTSIVLEPPTGDGTLGIGTITYYDPSDIDKIITLALVDDLTKVANIAEIGIEGAKRVKETQSVKETVPLLVNGIDLFSTNLTKTGANTATFKYKLSSYGKDVTKLIPASQLEVTVSIDSTIALDPETGTGTITFNSTDTDQIIRITLADKLTGMTAIINTLGLGKNPAKKVAASEISSINFGSSDLIKTGENTAAFNYKILDHHYEDITQRIPVADINATAVIGSSKAEISLDPSTKTGTITYKFSDTDKKAMVVLMCKSGVEVSAMLNIASLKSENNNDNNNSNLEIAQITFVLSDMQNLNVSSELQYKILNKYGKDITRQIPASQLALSSSISSGIYLRPSQTTYVILDYNLHDLDRTIIVSLWDKVTGVKAALNIGNEPTDTLTDETVVNFKNTALEQTIRTIIYKPIGDIVKNDLKNILELTVDENYTDLSEIEKLTNLNTINICSDKIKDLSSLSKVSHLRGIVYNADSIGDIRYLKEFTNLSYLDIRNTKISDEDLDSLRNALPKCYIFH
jgi:hypothetical protein